MCSSDLLLSGILGVLIIAFTLVFSKQILIICGATESVMPLASSYLNITAWGLFFLLFTTAASSIIRSDGSPTYSMLCNVIGAVLNIFLDYLLMFIFKMGIEGAAIATVIGVFHNHSPPFINYTIILPYNFFNLVCFSF